MKTVIRVVITFFVFIATFYFVFWVPASLIPLFRGYELLPTLVSLLTAAGISWFCWKKTYNMSEGLASHVLFGGIVVGAIGFVLGFFGPLIFYPESNQGPLLGIFFTGPIGFVAGLVGGGIYWYVKRRKGQTA